MISVVILGGGNVAQHFAKKFINSNGIRLVQIYNRSLSKIKDFSTKTDITNDIFKLKKADIYLIAVSDSVISEVSKNLDLEKKLVVHTSGAMELNELKSNSNKGVFYPLQTFSKDRNIDFSRVPICIENESEKDDKLLKKLAKHISSPFYIINSEKRKKLHLAAVFVNNFTNHLYHIAENICDDSNIPFEILKPLINETSNKLETMSPKNAQTGPATRGDLETIKNHLKILSKNNQEIYTLLTKSIASLYGKKL